MAHYITSRPTNPDVGSSAAFAKAKTWLAECADGHTNCQQISPELSVMPTRVLEISLDKGDKYTIRLHESGGEIGSYAALSYVWGGDQKSKTLKTNIMQYMRQIDSNKLPRTIMDAVICTQKLGLKYLWVDSLCIIQDSEEDQEKEIGRMSEIYKNAYVTISAAKATSSEEGFLEPRMAVEDLLKISFRLDILTPKNPVALNEWIYRYGLKPDFSNFISGSEIKDHFKASVWNSASAWYDKPSTIFLAARTPGQGDKNDPLAAIDIKDEPISTRGWTLQESWLSSRMLIYGSAQLLWICREKVQVDGGIKGSSSNGIIRNSYRINERGEMIYDGRRVTGSEKEFIFRLLWEEVLKESSKRTLTVPGDKLNALEGIVQELRLQTGDEYLAGIWRKRLVSDLSWYQYDPRKASHALKCNTERTCPSWSWIKTDGRILFSHAENSNVEVQYARVLRQEIVRRRLIVEGYIRLRAPMSALTISECGPNFIVQYPGSFSRAFTNMIFPDGGFENEAFEINIINGEMKTIAPPDMRFLELSWGKQDGSQDIANESRGLVLVSANTDGLKDIYRRVGFFVVALEEDLEKKRANVVGMLSFEPENETGNLTPTEFGKVWKTNLKVEEITLV